MKTDILIIGAGPAGIFTALEMLRRSSGKSITLVDQGSSIAKRKCPKYTAGRCVGCKTCAITSGFSGAGAFSDGKLSLSPEVGGDLPELIGYDFAAEMIGYTDGIYLEFGADKKVEGVTDTDAIKRIRTKAILAGLKLVDCPIRHLGTEKAQTLYLRVENALKDGGVNIIFNAVCKSLTVENDRCTGAEIFTRDGILSVRAQKTVVATGRIGEDWLETECRVHNVKRSAGPVDIGVRVEVRNEIMEEVNEALYESKLIGYPEPYRDKVRTFCQNPGGFVSQENYANGLAVVNGHSFKDVKSDNTNLAILSSHHFMIPFDRPTEYAKKTGELCNMLGDGKILVQRLGDITNGKRTWQKELARSNIVPTLKDAVAGDITSAMPFRAMSNILSFINAMDKIVPGFAGHETLLYSPEIKFYSNKIELDSSFQTNIEGLYALGDSSGWTRGLMMASVMGVIMGQKLA